MVSCVDTIYLVSWYSLRGMFCLCLLVLRPLHKFIQLWKPNTLFNSHNNYIHIHQTKMKIWRCTPVTRSPSFHLFLPFTTCLQNCVDYLFYIAIIIIIHKHMSQFNPLMLDSNIPWNNTEHWDVWTVLQGTCSLVRPGLHCTWEGYGSKISLLLSGGKTNVEISKTHNLNNYCLVTGRLNTIKWEKQRSKHTAVSLINMCTTAMYLQRHTGINKHYASVLHSWHIHELVVWMNRLSIGVIRYFLPNIYWIL